MAARAATAAVAVAAALPVLAAGPAASASEFRPLARGAAPAVLAAAVPAKVKYYIVPPPSHGSAPTLYGIAAATLGNGSLFMEIFNLNKGRLQPNGRRLENPRSVEAGWILELPADAAGPGVHFGRLPVTVRAAGRAPRPAPRHSSRPRVTRVALASATPGGSGALVETMIGIALLLLASAGLALVLRSRRGAAGGGSLAESWSRWAGNWGRRPAAHARPQEPRYGGSAADLTTSAPTAGGPRRAGPAVGYPGYPAGPGSPGGPAWPYGDHPSWPANSPGRPVTGADYPSWPAADPGRPVPAGDYPSWPGAPGEPGVAYADHPSWPASDLGRPVPADGDPGGPGGPGDPDWPYGDHPSWPANSPGRPVMDHPYSPAGADGPGRPRTAGRGGPGGPGRHGGSGLPQRQRIRESPAALHHDPRWRTPVRGRHTRAAPGYPAGAAASAGDPQQRWSAQLARATGDTTQTYYDLDFGDGRLQVMLTEAAATSPGWAGGPGGYAGDVLQLPGAEPAQGAVPASWEIADPGNADAVRVAQRILADADQQAAEIRLEAAAQAAAVRQAAEDEAAGIRRRTEAEAAPIREGAEREAAVIRERAATEAAAIREAAEREVEELRATARTMLADLDQLAAYITERFTGPIERVTGTTAPAPAAPRGAGPASAGPAPAPARIPAGAPSPGEAGPYDEPGPYEEAAPGARAASGAMPATAPARPGTRPRPARPGTRPGKPATKPGKPAETPGRSRQYRTMRVFAGTIAALVVLALGTGAYQLATRGYTFFVFRSAGTGATDNGAVFPGVIPTPKPSPAHHHPAAHHHTTGPGHHHGARGAHRHHHHRVKAHQAPARKSP